MDSAWKNFRELSVVLVGKQGLSLKQRGKIHQFCVRLVLLDCCETWELTIADEPGLCVGEGGSVVWLGWCVGWGWSIGCRLMFFGTGWVMRRSKTLIQSRPRWYGYVIRRDINSQVRQVMELEITGKRKKGRPRRSWEDCVKKDLELYGLRREDVYDREKCWEQIKGEIANPGQPGIMVFCCFLLLFIEPYISQAKWNRTFRSVILGSCLLWKGTGILHQIYRFVWRVLINGAILASF